MSTLRLLSVALVLSVVGLLAGCSKVQSYPQDLDPDKKMTGRVFETTQDMYIFRWRNYKPPLPAFTVKSPTPGLGLPELPPNVDPRFIDQKYDTVIILGVLKKGTRIKVNGVRRVSPEDHRFDIYDVDVLDALNPAFPKLDAFWITDNRPGRPKHPSSFAPEFVKEVKP